MGRAGDRQEGEVTLVGEGFNIFNFDNDGLRELQAAAAEHQRRFGQPNSQFNTRRFQIGARIGL